MKYSFIKNSMSQYHYSGASNFFRSFGLFCCAQVPGIHKLNALLDSKNLDQDMSDADVAKLADHLAQEFIDEPTLKTDANTPYANLIKNLAKELFGADFAVIDLCIQAKNSNTTIDTTTFASIQ